MWTDSSTHLSLLHCNQCSLNAAMRGASFCACFFSALLLLHFCYLTAMPFGDRASREEMLVTRKLLQSNVLARSEHQQAFHAAAEGSDKQTPGTKSNPIQN